MLACQAVALPSTEQIVKPLKINLIILFEHLQAIWLKSIVHLVGIKPNASHILGEWPNH